MSELAATSWRRSRATRSPRARPTPARPRARRAAATTARRGYPGRARASAPRSWARRRARGRRRRQQQSRRVERAARLLARHGSAQRSGHAAHRRHREREASAEGAKALGAGSIRVSEVSDVLTAHHAPRGARDEPGARHESRAVPTALEVGAARSRGLGERRRAPLSRARPGGRDESA